MQLCSAGDGNNSWLLGQQPGKGNLRRSCVFLCCYIVQQINHSLIGFSVFFRKTWNGVSEVGFLKLGVFINFSGKETFAKRTKGYKANSKFLKGWYYFLFRFSMPQRIFTLESCYRLNRMCTADCLRACFGKSKVLYFTFLDQILYRTCHLFNRNIWVNPVLIV